MKSHLIKQLLLSLGCVIVLDCNLVAKNPATVPVTINGSAYGYNFELFYGGTKLYSSPPQGDGSTSIDMAIDARPGVPYSLDGYSNVYNHGDRPGSIFIEATVSTPPGYSVYAFDVAAGSSFVENRLVTGDSAFLGETTVARAMFAIVENEALVPATAGRLTRFGVDDLLIEFGLGTTQNGKSAGRLQLRHNGMVGGSPGFDSSVISKLNVRTAGPPELASGQAVYKIENVSATKTELRFYARDANGTSMPQPFVTYDLELITNSTTPNAPTNSDCIRVTQRQEGTAAYVREAYRHRSGDMWTIIEGSGSDQRIEEHLTVTSGNERVATITTKNSSGAVLTKNRYTSFQHGTDGELITKEEIGIDGLLETPLITTKRYYITGHGFSDILIHY